ncbi:helicase-related protein [Kitasatospora aureofaciens]|uniref:helicase-related protein n=1 Tax=Kitasatospora aureofaciens TaxID=1894 RepID=UPI0009A0B043
MSSERAGVGHGVVPSRDRRAAFAECKAHTGEERDILCNSRLLTEGIDVAAVDAVCFADPKPSVIDLAAHDARAVGRITELRAHPLRSKRIFGLCSASRRPSSRPWQGPRTWWRRPTTRSAPRSAARSGSAPGSRLVC